MGGGGGFREWFRKNRTERSCHNSQNFLGKTGFIICRDESNQQIKTEFNSRVENPSNFNKPILLKF